MRLFQGISGNIPPGLSKMVQQPFAGHLNGSPDLIVRIINKMRARSDCLSARWPISRRAGKAANIILMNPEFAVSASSPGGAEQKKPEKF
jgi:hypothetical protein